MLKIIEALATVGTLLGLFLITEGLTAYGFSVGAFANLAWIYWAHEQKNGVGIMVVNAIMLILNFNGLGNI